MKILIYVKITSFVTISTYAKNFRQLTRHWKVLSIENVVQMFKISSGDSQGKMSKDQIKEQRHSKFIVSGCLIYCCILRANHTPMIKWWMSECPEWLTLQITHLLLKEGLPRWLSGKESASNPGDTCLIPGLERSPGKGIGYPLHYSRGSLMAQTINNPPAPPTYLWVGKIHLSLSRHGNPLQYSCLENSHG